MMSASIGRRGLVAGGLLAVTPFAGTSMAASLAKRIPAGNRLAFRLIRNGSVIGQHSLTFEPAGSNLTVRVAVDISVGLGPISLFRYSHRATEHWQDGVVASLEARTDDDGTQQTITVRRQGERLMVQGSLAPSYLAPLDALPATHWNRTMLDGPLINTQNGKLMKPTVTLVGTERLLVLEAPVEARHYQLRGDADLDTWYDPTPSWVALRFTAKDGSEIRYERV